jgi:hypothetical protein
VNGAMTVAPARRLLVALLVAGIALGQLYDTAVDGDHWPFSSYPMFAQPREATLRARRLVGVTTGGQEIPIVVPRDLPPFHEARLMTAFKRLGRRQDRAAQLAGGLEAALALYERRRLAAKHDGPALRGMRLYLIGWPFDPEARNRRRPSERRLLAEVRR